VVFDGAAALVSGAPMMPKLSIPSKATIASDSRIDNLPSFYGSAISSPASRRQAIVVLPLSTLVARLQFIYEFSDFGDLKLRMYVLHLSPVSEKAHKFQHTGLAESVKYIAFSGRSVTP
jgi:hypothetical protein